jgi:hypothetical protein
MSNMSYCRFQNTSGDLQDCLEVMQELIYNWERLSQKELSAMHNMKLIAEEFLELYDDLEELKKRHNDEEFIRMLVN